MKSWKIFWLLSGIVLVVSSLVIAYLSSTDRSRPQAVAVIGRGNVEQTVLASGIIKPSVQVSVGAQVSGQLKKLYVKQGERVKKGQLLAEIDPTLQLNELLKAEAELQSSQAQIQSTKALLKQKWLTRKRQLQLDREGAGVKSNLEDAQAQYESQAAQLKVNEAMNVQAQTALDTAKANLAYTRITAPIDGEVLGIITKEGQTIVSSQTAPTILVLADVETMVVHTRISETDILKVHKGQPLRFFVVADPHQQYDGTMGEIQEAPAEALIESDLQPSQGAQPAAVYYNGEFKVANKSRRLRTLMTAQVFIITAQAKNVLRIPVEALGEPVEKDCFDVKVLIAENIEKRRVCVGIDDGQYAEVKAGLPVGVQVVLPQDSEDVTPHE